MNAPGDSLSPHQQALDWLFARLGGDPDPGPVATAEPRPDDGADAAAIGPPPTIQSPEDLSIATQWLQRERQRLAAYTRSQLTRIQQEHQALLQQNYHNEQCLILRCQEAARQEEVLQAQGRALQQQAEDLARREQSLVGQLQDWWQRNEQLAALEEVTQGAQQNAAREQAVLQALQSETASAKQARESARAELDRLLAAGEALRQSRAKEKEALQARHAQLEQRLLEADKATLAAEQRQADLDDLETRLHREFEEQDRDLRRQRRELAALEARLRGERSALAGRGRADQPEEGGWHPPPRPTDWGAWRNSR
jgi:hypothetical protein